MIRSPIRFYYSKLAFTRLLFLFLGLMMSVAAEPYELIRGQLPILIVSAHGGGSALDKVPKRTKEVSLDPQFSAKKDLVTDVLAHRYHHELSRSNKNRFSPSLLLSHIHRKYLDLNRPLLYGADHPTAKKAHKSFHRALDTEIQRLKEQHGWVLVLDIHGQSAEKTDLILGTRQGQSTGPWTERVLWGENGVLSALREQGFSVAPAQPSTHYRFGGGYITQHYGADPLVEVVQLEHGQALRFSASDNERFIQVFCEVLAEHLKRRTEPAWIVTW